MKRRTGGLLVAALCIQAALSYAGEPAQTPAEPRESIWRYTELCGTPEEIPEPKEQIRDDSGKVYRLKEQELLIVPVTGRMKNISGQTVYRGVCRSDEIPITAVMKVQDEESGEEFEAGLSLERMEYGNERWEDGFFFTATFHDYGSDYYSFNGMQVPHQEGKPALSGCEAELLKAIGMEREECLVDDYDWAGEPYRNEEGILCRDVLINGRQKVWDCTAVYSGLTKLPDYDRYRKKLRYEEVRGELRENSITPDESEVSMTQPYPEAAEEEIWDRLIRMIKRGFMVSAGIFFIIAAVVILRWILKKAKAEEDGKF